MPAGDEMLLLRPAQLLEGDMLDLEGDSVADTDQTDPVTRDLFEMEYVVVEGYVVETPACVRVDTDSGSWGFPADHELRVCRRTPPPTGEFG